MFRATRSRNLSRSVLTPLASPCFRRITLSAVEGPHNPPLDNRTLPDYFAAEVFNKEIGRDVHIRILRVGRAIARLSKTDLEA